MNNSATGTRRWKRVNTHTMKQPPIGRATRFDSLRRVAQGHRQIRSASGQRPRADPTYHRPASGLRALRNLPLSVFRPLQTANPTQPAEFAGQAMPANRGSGPDMSGTDNPLLLVLSAAVLSTSDGQINSRFGREPTASAERRDRAFPKGKPSPAAHCEPCRSSEARQAEPDRWEIRSSGSRAPAFRRQTTGRRRCRSAPCNPRLTSSAIPFGRVRPAADAASESRRGILRCGTDLP